MCNGEPHSSSLQCQMMSSSWPFSSVNFVGNSILIQIFAAIPSKQIISSFDRNRHAVLIIPRSDSVVAGGSSELYIKAIMNFYDVISPIHFLSKFSGLTIFSFNRKDFTARFSRADFLLIISTIAVNYYLNESFWGSFNLVSYYKSTIIRTSLPFLYYGKYLINVLTTFWGIVMRARIARLVQAIHDVDEMVGDWETYLRYSISLVIFRC